MRILVERRVDAASHDLSDAYPDTCKQLRRADGEIYCVAYMIMVLSEWAALLLQVPYLLYLPPIGVRNLDIQAHEDIVDMPDLHSNCSWVPDMH